MWSVSDFANHLGVSHHRALRMLKKLDEQLGGTLLMPSDRNNRGYTFVRATLQRAHPEYFESVVSLEERVEELEERLEELKAMFRRLAVQTGANTRGIEWVTSMVKRPARRAA
ncbi:MAG: hypothetical protein U0270_07635 [Labilithrix sp.]